MKARIIDILVDGVIITVALFAAGVQQGYAADPVCGDNSAIEDPPTEQVCAVWSKPSVPVLGTDFFGDYTCEGCASAPRVELAAEDLGWELYAEVISTHAPANIGDLALDETVTDENFGVSIVRGRAAGAADVTSIYLDAPKWTGYSSLMGGEITGDLDNGIKVKRVGGDGGEITDFTIGGNAGGVIEACDVSGLTITGALTGDLRPDYITGTVEIGALSGSVGKPPYGVELSGGILQVNGAVGETAVITIADMVTQGTRSSLYFNHGGAIGSSDFEGELELQNGIPAGQVVHIRGVLTSNGSVDLTGDAVGGTLSVYGGGSGSIINGGAVTGVVLLGKDATTYTGTATFASVALGGTIETNNADFDGTLKVIGYASRPMISPSTKRPGVLSFQLDPPARVSLDVL